MIQTKPTQILASRVSAADLYDDAQENSNPVHIHFAFSLAQFFIFILIAKNVSENQIDYETDFLLLGFILTEADHD